MLETARDASKATAEVACGCELCFNRLSQAVGSGEGAGSIGRATDAVGYEDLRVLSVWGVDKHHTEMDSPGSGLLGPTAMPIKNRSKSSNLKATGAPRNRNASRGPRVLSDTVAADLMQKETAPGIGKPEAPLLRR